MKISAKVMLVLIALLAALLATAPAMSASPYTATDKAYLSTLADYGYTWSDGGTVAVTLGHQIAVDLRATPTFATINQIIAAGVKAGVDPYEVGIITAAAVIYYAPELVPLLKSYVGSYENGAPHKGWVA